MTQLQPDEKARFRRQRTEQAIQLAMQNRWEDAVSVNKAILEVFPHDVEAYNRLGKSLVELGRFSDARQAYASAVELDPNNSIARKNLNRLNALRDAEVKTVLAQPQLDPRIFIEETGKTGFTELRGLAGAATLAKLSAGEPVQLVVEGKEIVVLSARSERLGTIEPRLALRLINLMRGGNQYLAGVKSVSDKSVEIIIRETFQHPSQAGKLSFPMRDTGPVFRGDIRASLVRQDDDEVEEEEDTTEDVEDTEDAAWEESDTEVESLEPESLEMVQEGSGDDDDDDEDGDNA